MMNFEEFCARVELVDTNSYIEAYVIYCTKKMKEKVYMLSNDMDNINLHINHGNSPKANLVKLPRNAMHYCKVGYEHKVSLYIVELYDNIESNDMVGYKALRSRRIEIAEPLFELGLLVPELKTGLYEN